MHVYLADLAHTYSLPDSALTVPLNVGYIKAYAIEQLGSNVEIRLFKHPEKLLAAVYDDAPDVLGLSNYGWNEQINLHLGRYLREKYPDMLIVAGGPNIDPDLGRITDFIQRHNYLDFIIDGGGEEAFCELLQWWQDDSRDTGELPQNLHFLKKGSLRSTPKRKLEKNITNIPSPYLNGYLDEFLEMGMIPMFETNRGCPFHCTFCVWGVASLDLVRRMDKDIALREIEYVSEKSTATKWIFCDANFGILKRDVDIARAIKAANEKKGWPLNCQLWTAKNVTERNLEIVEILGDMISPVMAVQSLADEVLEHVKRSNISTDTYVRFLRAFHHIGSRTYSDLIVPLPRETLESHLQALRELTDFGVDAIQSHNVRLLAGAELNLPETRRKYEFRTRYRLIHGDAGIYRSPDGGVIKCFECEESVRSTTTMSEENLFFLRKLHFIVDFCWNTEVYKPLLCSLQAYGFNPIDILGELILEPGNETTLGVETADKLRSFWERFDKSSQEEWFDSEADILAHFSDDEAFERLINQKYDKLNILYAFILLREYKGAFDDALMTMARGKTSLPDELTNRIGTMTLNRFPSLSVDHISGAVELPSNYRELTKWSKPDFQPSRKTVRLTFERPAARDQIQNYLDSSKKYALSKLFDVSDLSIRALKFTITESV
jgi:putative methyltransferase